MSVFAWIVTALLAVLSLGIIVWGLAFLSEMTYEQERVDRWDRSADYSKS